MNTDSLLDAAHRARAAGRPDDASALCIKLLAAAPRHQAGLNLYGTLLAEQGRLAEAKEVLCQAVAVAPDSPVSHTNLGSVYLMMDNNVLAQKHFEDALRLDPASAETAFNLAEIHRRLGQLDDARRMLLRSIELRPRFSRAHRFLAELLESSDLSGAFRHMAAAAEIEAGDPALQLDAAGFFYRHQRTDLAAPCLDRVPPGHEAYQTVRFVLASLRGETVESAPRSCVQSIFDVAAQSFDAQLGALGYSAPEALASLHAEIGGLATRVALAVDFGCGTGLSGIPFRPRADRLVGVDLSPGMIDMARQRGIYDELVVADALEYLAKPGRPIDLVLAADVLVYVGALDPLFAAWSRRAAPGAMVLFSIEEQPAGTFLLQASGRYAHSLGYVEAVAEANGFTVVANREAQTRKEGSAWVSGHLFALKKR